MQSRGTQGLSLYPRATSGVSHIIQTSFDEGSDPDLGIMPHDGAGHAETKRRCHRSLISWQRGPEAAQPTLLQKQNELEF